MKFEDAKLPTNPDIEKAFAAASAFYGNDQNAFFKESLWEAQFLSANLADKNPVTIGAALLAPAVAVYGADVSAFAGTPLMEAIDNLVNGKPDMAVNAANVLATVAYGATDLQNKYAESVSLAAGIRAGDMADAYARAAERHRKDLLGDLNLYEAFVPKVARAVQAKEPQLVNAVNAVLEATAKALAPKTPAKTKGPAPAA